MSQWHSSSRIINLCIVPVTLPDTGDSWASVHFKNLLKYWLLTDLFQTLLSWSRTHLHIAVVHDTARNICIISFRAFKITQIRGLVFNSTTMILFTLLYPLFISCYCFSSIFYVQRIINKCLYIIWSLECMFCQIFWAGELSSSWYISPCIALCLAHQLRRFLSLCSIIILFEVAA